jgi:hypothetical protein
VGLKVTNFPQKFPVLTTEFGAQAKKKILDSKIERFLPTA